MDRAVFAIILMFTSVIGLGASVLWIVMIWRIMRAVERISDTLSEAVAVRPDLLQPAPAEVSEPDPVVVQQNVLNKLVQDGD